MEKIKPIFIISLPRSGSTLVQEVLLHIDNVNSHSETWILLPILFSLKPEQRITELKKMGWHNDTLFRKQFSSAFVDENGVLQNFDFPTEVKKTSTELEAA